MIDLRTIRRPPEYTSTSYKYKLTVNRHRRDGRTVS